MPDGTSHNQCEQASLFSPRDDVRDIGGDASNGNVSAMPALPFLHGSECVLVTAFLEVGLEMIAQNYISLDDQLAWRLTCRTLRGSISTARTGGFVTTTAVAAIAKGRFSLVCWALADVQCPPDRLCMQLSACGRVQELEYAVNNYCCWSASPSCAEHLYACIRAAADHSRLGVLEWALQKGHIGLSTEGHNLYIMLVSNDMFDESLPTIVQLVRSPFVLSTDLDASAMNESGMRSRLYMVLQALRALPPTYEVWHGISVSGAPDAGYEEADVIDYFFALGCTDMLGQDAICTRDDVADALECLAGLGYAQEVVGFYNNTYGSFFAPRVSPSGTAAGPSVPERPERSVGYYLVGEGLNEREREHPLPEREHPPQQEQVTECEFGASSDEALASMILPSAPPGESQQQAQQQAQLVREEPEEPPVESDIAPFPPPAITGEEIARELAALGVRWKDASQEVLVTENTEVNLDDCYARVYSLLDRMIDMDSEDAVVLETPTMLYEFRRSRYGWRSLMCYSTPRETAEVGEEGAASYDGETAEVGEEGAASYHGELVAALTLASRPTHGVSACCNNSVAMQQASVTAFTSFGSQPSVMASPLPGSSALFAASPNAVGAYAAPLGTAEPVAWPEAEAAADSLMLPQEAKDSTARIFAADCCVVSANLNTLAPSDDCVQPPLSVPPSPPSSPGVLLPVSPPPCPLPVMPRAVHVGRRRVQHRRTWSAAWMLVASLCCPLRAVATCSPPRCAPNYMPAGAWAQSSKAHNRLIHALNGNLGLQPSFACIALDAFTTLAPLFAFFAVAVARASARTDKCAA